MKTSAETKRINNKASHTALIAAIYRFLASKERRPGYTGPGNMTYAFLPSKARFFLALDKKSPGSYEYVCARTRFFGRIYGSASTVYAELGAVQKPVSIK